MLKIFSHHGKANQNHTIPFIPRAGGPGIKKEIITRVGRDAEKLHPHAPVLGTYNDEVTVENSLAVPQKVVCRFLYDDLTLLLLGIYLRKMKTNPHNNLYANAHSNIIFNILKVETIQCLSTDKRKNSYNGLLFHHKKE